MGHGLHYGMLLDAFEAQGKEVSRLTVENERLSSTLEKSDNYTAFLRLEADLVAARVAMDEAQTEALGLRGAYEECARVSGEKRKRILDLEADQATVQEALEIVNRVASPNPNRKFEQAVSEMAFIANTVRFALLQLAVHAWTSTGCLKWEARVLKAWRRGKERAEDMV